MAATAAEPPIRNKKKKSQSTAQIKDRVAREEKAYRIVERLIDNPVPLSLLTKCLRHINQQHYSDIVEERAIEKHCGYPICTTPLPKNVPKQKYCIDTRVNKVFDLTDRKQFCSDKCCAYSRGLKDQLSTEPVWLLTASCHAEVKIITLPGMREGGDDSVPNNIKVSEKFISSETNKQPVSVLETVNQKTADKAKDENIIVDFSSLTLSDDEVEEAVLPILSSLGHIRQALIEWRTDASTAFFTNTNVTDDPTDDLDDYLLDDDLKIDLSQRITKGIPSFSDLDTDLVQIRESNVTERCTNLPRLDSVNQSSQRQNIVLNKLRSAFSKLLSPVPLSYGDISHSLLTLISKLHLSAHNIMFSEKQWGVIACVILKGLFIGCDGGVVKTFGDLEGVEHFIGLCLDGLGVSVSEFEELYKLLIS